MEDFFADIPNEGGKAFEEEEGKDPGESQDPKEEEEKEEPSRDGEEEESKDEKSKDKKSDDESDNNPDEKDVPFHKHPRFKELVDERNEYREKFESLEKKISQIEDSKKKDEPVAVPKWFSDLYGDDKDLWSSYRNSREQDKKEIIESILSELKEQQQKQTEENKKDETWVADEIKSLRDEGKKFDENRLMKIMEDYMPTNSKGSLDFKKGYQIYELMKKEENKTIDTKKKIADTSSNKGGSGNKSDNSDVPTMAQVRKWGW